MGLHILKSDGKRSWKKVIFPGRHRIGGCDQAALFDGPTSGPTPSPGFRAATTESIDLIIAHPPGKSLK